MSTLHNVSLITSALNIIQPDLLTVISSVRVADELTVVSDSKQAFHGL